MFSISYTTEMGWHVRKDNKPIIGGFSNEWEAIQWLYDHGYTSEARKLEHIHSY